MLPHEIMVMSGSVLPPRAKSGTVTLLWPGSVLIPVAYVGTEGHVNIYDLCCSLRPSGCLWTVLSLGVMLM